MAKRSNPDGLKKLLARVSDPAEARVGFFETSKYPDGTPVAYVASIHEFGFKPKKIPQRSFIRSTIAEERANWGKLMETGARLIIRGKMTVSDVMEGVGLQAEGDMKAKIASIYSPKLKASTLYNRRHRKDPPPNKSEKPLNDTGLLLASLTHVVERP